MPNIRYRRLAPSDSKAYRAIRLESLQTYPNSFGSSYTDQVQKDKLAFERYIETSASSHFIVGAFQNNQLIGI
ncbi:MAG: GNAT family N-acetyltransferase, partial [Bacteroidota bacterium]